MISDMCAKWPPGQWYVRNVRRICDRRYIIWVIIASSFREGVIVLDIEPLLSDWGGSDEGGQLEKRVAEIPVSLRERVVLVTNSRRYSRSAGVAIISGVRKPFTSLRRLGDRKIAVVVGDTLVTDGLLAYRLNVPFFQIRLNQEGRRKPFVVYIESVVGAVLEFFFERCRNE